ncbi:hypothetical protein ACPCKP_21640 [Streptomyces cellulosae]
MPAQGAKDALDDPECTVDHTLMTDHNERFSAQVDVNLMQIPDPETSPTISVATAARLAGVALRTGYAAAERGEWPVIRTGRAVRVRTRDFLRQCGYLEAAV